MTEGELFRLVLTQAPNFVGFIILALVLTRTLFRLIELNERLTMRCIGVCKEDDEESEESG